MFNMDYTQRIVMESAKMEWEPSPMPGVRRKRFAFEEVERGHATSIVEFEAGSAFRRHGHPGGEEILVLEGVFSDETGDFPAGSYMRNPEGFSHEPFSREGCVILVKLHQFRRNDSKRVLVDTKNSEFLQGQGNLTVLPLHEYGEEHTALVHWPAGERFAPHRHQGGEEIYVISGELMDEHGVYPAGSWIRSPHLSEHFPYVEEETLLFVKTGHLGMESGKPGI